MVERKLYKTRLCVLYKKGHCPRQTCSFAHGDAELRRFNTSSSFSGRRDYRGSDLRDKLGRRHSPPRRHSLDRDARDRHSSRGHHSPRSGKKSDWNDRKRHRFDGESDFSGSLRMSDRAEDQARDRKPTSTEFKNVHDEQLKQLELEIDLLEDDKQHLEICLEERAQEADSLNCKIEELEMQLSLEKEECKRISSKIRKFVKAYNRHSKIQDELKRSEARLQKLGDHLGSDIRAVANEEDININILSEEETLGIHLTGPRIEQHKDAYPSKKRSRAEVNEGLKQENATKGEASIGKTRFEKHSRWGAHLTQSKDSKEVGIGVNRISDGTSLVNEGKTRPGQNTFATTPLPDKLKDSKSGLALPITGIAAYATDELVELDEKFEADEIDSALDTTGLQLPLSPPPPLLLQKAYLQISQIITLLGYVSNLVTLLLFKLPLKPLTRKHHVRFHMGLKLFCPKLTVL